MLRVYSSRDVKTVKLLKAISGAHPDAGAQCRDRVKLSKITTRSRLKCVVSGFDLRAQSRDCPATPFSR